MAKLHSNTKKFFNELEDEIEKMQNHLKAINDLDLGFSERKNQTTEHTNIATEYYEKNLCANKPHKAKEYEFTYDEEFQKNLKILQ